MNIKISVIITAYNVENFISQCLDSVINNYLKEIEIICIDDCSVDGTYDILKSYSKIDNRIILIRNDSNKGQSRSINIGLDLAKGEYVYFLDSDDYIANNFLYELYNTGIKYKADIIHSSNVVELFYDEKLKTDYKIKNNEKIINWKKQSQDLEGYIEFSIKDLNIGKKEYVDISPWNKIVKLSFIRKHNLYWTYIPNLKDHINDFNFFYKLFYNNPKMAYNHNVEYFHRFRNNSFMSSTNNDINRIIAVIERMKDLFEYCNKKDIELTQYITPRIFCGLLYNFNIMDNKKEIYDYIRDYIKTLSITKNINIFDEDYNKFILFRLCDSYEDYAYSTYLFDKINNDIKLLKKLYNDNKTMLNNNNEVIFNEINNNRIILNNLINSLAWWIPIKKWRDNFRNKFFDNFIGGGVNNGFKFLYTLNFSLNVN